MQKITPEDVHVFIESEKEEAFNPNPEWIDETFEDDALGLLMRIGDMVGMYAISRAGPVEAGGAILSTGFELGWKMREYMESKNGDS